jgi:hypothetical protein
MANGILTPPQQRFVKAILEGKSQKEAYIAARFPGGRPSLKDADLRKRGSDMGRAPAVQEALVRAQTKALDAATITVQTLVEDLQESRRAAFACDPPQISATVAATVAIGKLLGLMVERKEVELVVHKPGFNVKALELTEEEWVRQYALPAPPAPGKGTDRNGR